MSEDLDIAPIASSKSATEDRQESMPDVGQDDERACHENISTISSPFLTNTAGKIVYIEFLLSSDTCLFSIDFFTTDDDSGIAFHMEIRSDDQLVTFNSEKDNTWGQTETTARFPFEHGGRFVLTIETTAGCYETKVNGKLLYAFNHRWPIESVKRFRMIQEQLKDVQVSVNVLRPQPAGQEGWQNCHNWDTQKCKRLWSQQFTILFSFALFLIQ
ncbi:galectin-4-like isoform X3 [Corticium candelabrum]|uniref:galectin-4-like isoform X3 n=1 Tax=Corticium candelabrum TaxID=121492 RepID=UPI002E25AC7C|nr:galectin-4-like isoform X3 [Corticium candelabrum]